MEDDEHPIPSAKCSSKSRAFRRPDETASPAAYHHFNRHLLHASNGFGYGYSYDCGDYGYGFTQNLYQACPGLLPLPPLMPLHLAVAPPSLQNQGFSSKTHFSKQSRKCRNPHPAASADSHVRDLSVSRAPAEAQIKARPAFDRGRGRNIIDSKPKPKQLEVARRPDSGGVEGKVITLFANHFLVRFDLGKVITLFANHFLVRFDPSQRIFHYDVEISPNPSKDIAREIKRKLVHENSSALSGAVPVYDGRRTLYSPVEFQEDRLEFYVTLPLPVAKVDLVSKIFRVSIKLVSKLDGRNLSRYLDKEDDPTPLPQEYIHALDVVLRETPTEKCIATGRSLYTRSMGGEKDIGGGAVALRGFFQSLRPTQQGLALNVDFSVTAFHESIGVIPYLQKIFPFMHDVCLNKDRFLTKEERKEVEKAMKNIRVFVRHRETVQRYRFYSLTDEVAGNLWFPDRDGGMLKLDSYFKDQYGYDIQYKNLPCLQISRRKACYLPMELCVVCEGQKFLGKLSDDQTAKIVKLGCRNPRQRKEIIDGVMEGSFGPASGDHGKEFKLNVSKEMTRLTGRILHPPKLKLGNGGHVRNLTPSRHDRQWNLLDSHVLEGTRVERWAMMSFGGSTEQKFLVSKFMSQLSQKCEKLGIFLDKNTVVSPLFEPMHVLGNAKLLESKLQKIHTLSNLQLLICVMERKHKGYADLKRIAETRIGVVSQCCLYSNLAKPSSHFLANLALKINAKLGGCTVALYNSLPSQIPRVFRQDEPVIFLGADVTHPHPLDDSSPSVAAVVGSVNWPSANKYVSRMRSQTHRQEIIQDLRAMVEEILDDFYEEVSKLPERIVFFRDGVSETQFEKVLQEELLAIRVACSRYPSYNPPITFAVVQKRHHTRLFRGETESADRSFYDGNVPPGTVVDSIITHSKEFDFYLCSHWGVKGTSRPVHYHILWDENGFSSDEVQKLVYNLCYTFVRCTKPVSLVPPAYYAHLAAYRGRLYLERSDSSAPTRIGVSRASAPETSPLPKLTENIRKLMFYC